MIKQYKKELKEIVIFLKEARVPEELIKENATVVELENKIRRNKNE